MKPAKVASVAPPTDADRSRLAKIEARVTRALSMVRSWGYDEDDDTLLARGIEADLAVAQALLREIAGRPSKPGAGGRRP